MTDPVRADGPVLPQTRRGRWFVVVVLLVALGLRCAVVLATRDEYKPVTDALGFDLVASSLVDGHGIGPSQLPFAVGPSALRPPAYPATLAAVYEVVGPHSWTAGRLANAVIGTVLVALTGLLAALLLGRLAGAIALALAAVHPTLLLHASGLQLDPLLAVAVLGALCAALQHRRAPRGWRWPVVAGACLGVGILTRETAACMVLPVVLVLWAPRWRLSRAALGAPVLAVVVALAIVAPWTIRNAVRLHGFYPVTSGTGYGLAGTYNATSKANPTYPGLWIPAEHDPADLAVIEALPVKDERSVDTALRHEAFTFMADHPAYVPTAMFWNTVRMFDLAGPDHSLYISQYLPYDTRLTRVAVYASYAVYVLALAAAFTGRLRAIPKVVWLYPLLAWLLFAFVSGNIRYRASIEPFFLVAMAALLAALVERRRPVRA